MGFDVTFSFVCFTFIFFRAADVHQATIVIRRILSPHIRWQIPVEFQEKAVLICGLFGIAGIIAADIKTALFPGKQLFMYHRNAAVRLASCIALVLLIVLFGVFDSSQFIYFQF